MKRLINRQPGRVGSVLLTALPFVGVLLAYGIASALRLAENPNDPLLPSLLTLGESFLRLATEENRRTGDILLWSDTAASLIRLGLGVGISALMGLIIGIVTGLIPVVHRTLSPFLVVLSMIPPLALLPILFIVFGVGELSKVMLIIFGVAPFLIRDLQQRVEQLPREQLIKAQTLGASTWQIILRVVLPQVMPRLLDATRLALGSAWLFLIAAEAIAATEGLGYRIFLVRRYLDMETILPYVVWITLLAFAFDLLLRVLTRRLFPWYRGGRAPA
ncbi:lipid kinase [Ectothiorhodospira shaposhnikovii]|uniref:ABC transporter permease n=1 Tax=Ectothiorhodospira shaposhnikovii TaxID=1054 RepID=UPI001902C9F5|nr:ABC transporter permease subunit [Ectothiorhodospira shaposhnikovii]MBK1673603.1 lipid kinase [Ectothiorhodospira shaposhnikovii]